MSHCSLSHLAQQGAVSGFGQVEIRLTRLLGFLLEAVQDIDSLGELGDVDHPECPVSVSDANFPHALAHARWPLASSLSARAPVAPCRAGIPLPVGQLLGTLGGRRERYLGNLGVCVLTCCNYTKFCIARNVGSPPPLP